MIDVRDALEALESPRTQGRQRGQHPARLRGVPSFVRYIYPGTTPPETQVSLQLVPWQCTPAGRPLQHSQIVSSGLLERRPSAMSSPGSQSVSALHLLLAFEQGASAAGHRFGRQGCARARPLTGLSRPLPSSPPLVLVLALSPRRTTYHQVSKDRCSASSTCLLAKSSHNLAE
jgi:hypothetical protein